MNITLIILHNSDSSSNVIMKIVLGFVCFRTVSLMIVFKVEVLTVTRSVGPNHSEV